jgi:F0F1-type ATP synthase membrane subunit b/b'
MADCRQANFRWKQSLQEKREADAASAKSAELEKKRKQEIAELQQKRQKILQDAANEAQRLEQQLDTLK